MSTTDPSSPETPVPMPKAMRAVRVVRRLLAWLGSLTAVALSALLGPLVLFALAGALWAWTGTAGSLATALKLAAWALPSEQQLRISDVQGNLQQGGRIGQLQWQSAGLKVTAQNAHMALDWSQLWRQAWPVRSLHLQDLRIQDQRPAKASSPMTSLTLPLPLQLNVQVDQFTWKGATQLALSEVKAQYAFDGLAHQLNVQSLKLAQGRYTAQASLQATAPMALQVELQAQVTSPSKDSTTGLPLVLHASLEGPLSGPLAQLVLKAHLAPQAGQASAQGQPSDVQLDVQATLMPWAQQPIVQVQGRWQALNLAPFWPLAPQTRLKGQATVKPDATAWQLDAELVNALPGPWDQQRLPLSTLRLRARHDQGFWRIQQALSQLAGGQAQAQAQQTRLGWTGQVDLQNLLPEQLHTALSGPGVSGRVQASAQTPVQAKPASPSVTSIRLLADLSAQPVPSQNTSTRPSAQPLSSLQWEKLHLSGQWSGQNWEIDALRVQAAQALLEAQFTLQPALRSVQGQLTLQLPGLQAQAQGSLAPLQGQGSVNMAVQDASQSLAWLQTLPAWEGSLKALQSLQAIKATGPGLLEAQWGGGFAQTDTPLSLKLQWPRIEWRTPAAKPWVMAQGLLQLQGTPQAVKAQLQAQLGQGQPSAQVKTTLSARRADAHSWDWQGQIDQLQAKTLTLPAASSDPAPDWHLQLQQAMAWQAKFSGASPAVTWGPSQWQVQGPTPGTGHIQVEAGQWLAASPERPSQTQGVAHWQGMPLGWAQTWWRADIQNDVLLQGQLQWQIDKDLRLDLLLERSQGDVFFDTGQISGQRTAAGLSQAQLAVRILNSRLEAELNWLSEHLGQAQAHLQSQLSQTAQGTWQWPEQAPVQGSVQARLPQVGAWSVLAPPGWRVQGTLDANLTLSGTRSQAQWQGQLKADQLAVRSAVQGIEFSQGQMQARFQGQTLVLESLSLRGAGAQGGQLQATGQVNFKPVDATLAQSPSKADNPPWRAAVLDLKIQAKGLRVSNRADRRLTLSGQVDASMSQGQLQLRGGLVVDQALFILPDDSTPSLGEDVVVLGPGIGDFNLTDPRTATDGKAGQRSWLGVPDVQVTLDLGSDFSLQSKGLTTRLAGQLVLLSNASTQGVPQISGQVRTEGGRYKAYGQLLNIETGVLRFDGPYDNPSLDVIALRPNLPHKVGVQITGSALLPRIRLYAEPDIPDADKLAWLVLGRPAAGGGAESAVLQQAAVVLLSGDGQSFNGELAKRLGLDEISLATGSRSDANATGAAVTLGKRLSKDFYLAYETSLSGTFGSLYIFYDLSRRLTLRAQAGEQSALDLIFTVQHN